MALSRNKVIAGASATAVGVVAAALFMLSSESLPPQSQVIIGPQVPVANTWFDNTQVERGRVHGRAFPATPPTGAELDAYTLTHYYDLGMTLAAAYQRTGDQEFLDLFRKVEDSWWKTPNWIEEGRIRNFDVQGTAPKSAGIGGLILRAIDGRPEMWDWINAYTRYSLDLWLKMRINDPELYIGIREGGFALQYAAWLARLLPDSFPLQAGGTETNGAKLRAQYLADVEAITTQYFARLQREDGSWRWDDHYFTSDDGGQLRGVTQPFQVGLLLDALIDVYDATSNQAVKASIVDQVSKSCRHLYSSGPYSKQKLATLNVNLRGFHYFYHGGTTVNPTRYEKGDLPPDWNPATHSEVQNQRQPIGLIVAAYGWAYQRTGDRYFLDAGNELWDSAYGSTDSIHNYAAGDAKSYNQNYRWAGSYLIWGQGGGAAPTPQPSPQPTKTPSADGTKGQTVIDSQLATWTLSPQPEGKTLKDGSHVGGGQGKEYKYLSSVVYVSGMDNNWYRWTGSGWAWNSTAEPGVPSPSPSQTPAPLPSPSPTPTFTPSPSPSPTVTPKPSPTVTPLPTCSPNQIIGDPVKCLCVTGVKNNCRCR